MQQFFQNIQGKIWGYVVALFNIGTDFSNAIWLEWLKPFFASSRIFFANSFNKIFELFLQTIKKINIEVLITFIATQYELTEKALQQISKDNKNLYYAILILIALITIFWLAMIRHAYKNENWKKTWIPLIIVLGPFGATLYYFLRKRKTQASLERQDKVMMSFFSPMNKK